MKVLNQLIKNIDCQLIGKSNEHVVNQLVFDSRNAVKGTLFVALRGTVVDGHNYIQQAISNGCLLVCCEELPNDLQSDVVFIKVENTKEALANLSDAFYDYPSKKIKLIGVTGTNGKTTIATLLYDLFRLMKVPSGLLSTVKVMIGEEEHPATHTTPDSVSINRYLSEMVEKGVTHCFMEVSSHGIDQHRTTALDFDGGVFTNLTQDHLDYHKTFKAYRDVKKRFFDGLKKEAFVVTNIDDKNGRFMLQNTKASKLTYALKTMADYKSKILEKGFVGMQMDIQGNELWVQLTGQFNAYNILAVYAVASELGYESGEILTALSLLKSVSGRFQYEQTDEGYVLIVDYAHTPDALKNVLETIKGVRSGNEKIFTVVGCGGNRDKGKRPKMAQIAVQLSDQVIFTSDNPRDEDPVQIINDMTEGLLQEEMKSVLVIADRYQAIKTACVLMKKGDILLVAGKGHENYQEVKGERQYFNDFSSAKQILKEL